MIKTTWITFVALLAGMIDKQNKLKIEHLKEQIRILMETQGKKRIKLTDDQRRRLAIKAKSLNSFCCGKP